MQQIYKSTHVQFWLNSLHGLYPHKAIQHHLRECVLACPFTIVHVVWKQAKLLSKFGEVQAPIGVVVIIWLLRDTAWTHAGLCLRYVPGKKKKEMSTITSHIHEMQSPIHVPVNLLRLQEIPLSSRISYSPCHSATARYSITMLNNHIQPYRI